MYADQPLRAIVKLLGCSLSAAQQALLACFQTLLHQSAIALRLYSVDKSCSCSWQKASWDVLCRRRQDFHHIDDQLQAEMKQRSYAELTEGLDDIEDVTNEPERMKQQDMIDMWRMLSLITHYNGIRLGHYN